MKTSTKLILFLTFFLTLYTCAILFLPKGTEYEQFKKDQNRVEQINLKNKAVN
jgi:hypothetical protein